MTSHKCVKNIIRLRYERYLERLQVDFWQEINNTDRKNLSSPFIRQLRIELKSKKLSISLWNISTVYSNIFLLRARGSWRGFLKCQVHTKNKLFTHSYLFFSDFLIRRFGMATPLYLVYRIDDLVQITMFV